MNKTPKVLFLIVYLFLAFMFVGSTHWGDAQDTTFWGVLLILAYLDQNRREAL